MVKAKLVDTTNEERKRDRKYQLECAVCGARRWIGYSYYKLVYPSKKIKKEASGNCVACVNTKPNKTSFKKGQTPWNKGRWQKEPSYSAVHKWLVNEYGSANKCENKDCFGERRAYHWAKKRGCKYERKRENFMKLCAKCHSNYDFGNIDVRCG